MNPAPPPAIDPTGALPVGTMLAEFEIRKVLGEGGFGIVYLAFDHALEREVAVKEYMPSSLAGRSPSGEVSVRSESHVDHFSLGLRSFVNEARLLARFDHPALLKVYRYWEANRTAYMAMRYYDGRNLHQVRRGMNRTPDEAWVRGLTLPLLGALERLHADGVFHRDISPDNVLIEASGEPVLLDFGAARRVITDQSQSLTAVLKPAYAPIEQYGESPSLRQGPWTDLYALGATLHFVLLGAPPPPATSRIVSDEMPPLAQRELPGYNRAFLACVDWMLRPRPADRPQTVAALRAALAGETEVPPPQAQAPAAVTPPPAPKPPPRPAKPARPPVGAQASFEPTMQMPLPSGDAPPATRWVTTRKVAGRSPSGRRSSATATPAQRSGRWLVALVAALAVVAAVAWQVRRSESVPVPPDLTVSSEAPLLTPEADAAASGVAVAASEPALNALPQELSAVAPSPADKPSAARLAVTTVVSRPVGAAAPAAQNNRSGSAQTAAASAGAQSPAAAPVVAERPPEAAAPTPSPPVDDGDAMVVRTRQLSPTELCQGGNVLLKWACIQKQCSSVPALKNHPDCAQPAPRER